MQYRNNDYKYFDRFSGFIGIKALQTEGYYSVIETFLCLKENFDDIYGKDMLVKLVDVEMAERYDRALRKLRYVTEQAIKDREAYELLEMRVEICKRGLLAMRKYVEDNNLCKPPDIWIGELNEKRFGIVQNYKDVKRAKKINKDVSVFSLEEICEILRDYQDTIKAKETLDRKNMQATIVSVENNSLPIKEELDDDIPF